MPGTITAVNAQIVLTIPGVFDTPQTLQGFSADNIYDVDQQDQVETLMGVDGLLSGGFVFNPVNQTFTLQADSPSCAIFDQWRASQQQAKDTFFANGRTTLKAIGLSFVCTKGFLVSGSPIPTAARILQPRRFSLRWQSVQSTPSA